MIWHLLLITAALALLFLGASVLVKGSSSLALRTGINPLLVGLTVVAFGTSAPELAISIKAALAQQGDISVGNVIGSNSFNIGVILGLSALVCSLPVHRQIIRLDAPLALGAALLLPVFLIDHTVNRVEGLILLTGLAAYLWINITIMRRQANSGRLEEQDLSIPGISRNWQVDLALIISGLAVLVFGSRLLLDHSVALAQGLGVSEAVIGLTIVSAGTSMPELVTSLVAAFRRQPDIAVGNIIGSNLFNLFGILGCAAVISPLKASGILPLDIITMIFLSALLLPLLYTGRLLHRLEGLLLLTLYSGYLFFLWPK